MKTWSESQLGNNSETLLPPLLSVSQGCHRDDIPPELSEMEIHVCLIPEDPQTQSQLEVTESSCRVCFQTADYERHED